MQDPSLPGSGPPASPLSTVLNELDRDLGLMPTGKERVPFVLKPLTGRMVDVKRNVDVGRAFKLLEQSCARNRVRADFTKQRFHERPGLKRKRLRRERWKKRFLEGFKATVGRVKQLRAQGW
jgi:small subunit ribosomal protein MRP21